MWLEVNVKRHALRIEYRWGTARHPVFADEGLAPIAEHQPAVLDPLVRLTLLRERIFDLEEVGEVGRGLEAKLQVARLGLLVAHQQFLPKAVPGRPLSYEGEVGIDVNRAGPGDEEELGGEVIEVVPGERLQPLIVDGQVPAREETRVPGEQATRVSRRGLDVAGQVANDEGVAFEDAHRLLSHCHRSRRVECAAPARARRPP
jgi:hypothetical protein